MAIIFLSYVQSNQICINICAIINILISCIMLMNTAFPFILSFMNIPTMNNYINKLSCWYIEQRNYLPGPYTKCRIISNHISISKQSSPWSGSSYKSCLIWVCYVCKSVKRCLYGVNTRVVTVVQYTTVLPAKSDRDFMFCLQSYQRLIIDRLLEY